MLKHHVFLIHGITDRSNTTKDFKDLCDRIGHQFRSRHRLAPESYLEFVPVEWDGAVEAAEKGIFEKSFGGIRPADRMLVSSVLNPLDNLPAFGDFIGRLASNPQEVLFSRWNRWREWRYFATLFVGDVIAYTDENDNGIRRAVWKTLKANLIEKSTEVPTFSIIGHSLGSVIAFDFLFALLNASGPSLFDFGTGESPAERVDSRKLQQMKDAFCNLYTLGSPLSLFLMRKKQLWDGATGEPTFAAVRNPFHGTTHKWLNFLDTDDVVAYPVEPFFSAGAELGQKPNPSDIYVKSGWLPLPPGAHINYWRSDDVARRIAAALEPQEVRARELAGVIR